MAMARNSIVWVILITFFISSAFPSQSQAQTVINLPAPGMMVNTSYGYKPLQLKGIQSNSKNPMRFDFLVDKGDARLLGQPLKDEITRLTKYFLTCLTVPETDLWVNLSPYEKDRIAPEGFGTTQMGKDLLEQDYLLKQIAASLTYPERTVGQNFWQKIYQKAYEKYGTTDIPVNTFNKVWIVPKSAEVYVRGGSAFVARSELDVKLEEDYHALSQNYRKSAWPPAISTDKSEQYLEKLQRGGTLRNTNALGSQVAREILIPVLRKEVNEGKNFAVVRQVYDAMILATWYKRHLHDSLLGRMYVGKNKVAGVDVDDKTVKEKIFNRYLQAFKKHVYNYIKEDYDPFTQKVTPRKYVSGGMDFTAFGKVGSELYKEQTDWALLAGRLSFGSDLAMAVVNLSPTNDKAILGVLDKRVVSKKFRGFLAKVLLIGMLAVAGFSSLGASNAESYSLKPGDNGKMIVEVTKDDRTYGHMLAGISNMFEQLDPDGHRTSPYKGELWGEYGMEKKVPVKRVQGNVDKSVHWIKVGDKFEMPAVSPKAMETVQQAEPVINRAAQNAPAVQPPAPPSLSKVTMTPGAHLQNPTTSTPSTNTATLTANKITKWSSWIGMGAVAVAFGIGLTFALFKFKGNGSNGTGASSALNSSRNGSAPPPPPPPLSNQGSVAAPPDSVIPPMQSIPGLVIGSFGVTPATSQEIQQGQQLIEQLEQLKQNGGTINVVSDTGSGAVAQARLSYNSARNLRGMDIWGWLSGMALAGGAVAFGILAPAALIISAVALPFLTRIGYMLGLWKHEVMGHSVPAFLRYPKAFTTAFKPNNLRANLSLGQWLGLLIPFKNPKDFFPHMYFPPVQGQAGAAKFISRMGLFTTVVLGGAGLIGLGSLTWGTSLMPLLGPLAAGIWAILKEAWPHDWDPQKAIEDCKFGCGLETLSVRADTEDAEEDLDKFNEWVDWFEDATVDLTFRGGQEVGVATMYDDEQGETRLLEKKEVKSKRGISRNGFYTNLTAKVYSKFRRSLPKVFRPVYNFGKAAVRTVVAHVRFATGGDLVRKAAHPHAGPAEKTTVWRLVKGELKSFVRNVIVIIAHNGDNNGYRLFNTMLNVTQMREFFPRLLHYKDALPPGDSPVLPFQLHLHMTLGNARASMRFAHLFSNHTSAQEAMQDVLSEENEIAVGRKYDEVFGKVAQLLARPYLNDPSKSFKDLWVSEEMLARNPDLRFQYRLIQIFKEMLVDEMEKEARLQTGAAEVFRSWEQRWTAQGRDPKKAREEFVDLAVAKFFTGDRETATKEFYERAEGTYGIFVRTSLDDDGVTYLSRNQDIGVGFNLKEGIVASASDPRVLKGDTKTGKKIAHIMHLQDGEVVDFSFLPGNGMSIKSSLRRKGKWEEVDHSDEEAVNDMRDKRIYPNQEYVNGKKNRYYTPLVKYKDRARMLDEEKEMTAHMLHEAQKQWDDKNSFNRQSAANLAERLKASEKKRLVIIGYENSLWVSENTKLILSRLVPGLSVDIIDANEFIKDPLKYGIDPQTVVLVVSKSGATFPSRLSKDVVEKLAGRKNVFRMTARIDSVLNSSSGQGLYPDAPFDRQAFVIGNLYPLEAPVLSEELLAYNHMQMAFYLAAHLREMYPQENNPLGMKLTQRQIDRLAYIFRTMSLKDAQRMSGFDEDGNKIESGVHDTIIERARYLGKVQRESFVISRIMDLIVWGVFLFGGPLTNLFGAGGGLPDTLFKFAIRSLDFVFIKYLLPFLLTNWVYRPLLGRPLWGRLGPPNMFLGASRMVHQTQENFFAKLMANSLASTGMDVWGADPRSDFIKKLAFRSVRGDQTISFIQDAPADPDNPGTFVDDSGRYSVERSSTNMALQQLKFPKTGAFFGLNRLKSGAEVTTFGRGPFKNKSASNYHIDIAGAPVADLNEDEQEIYNLSVNGFANMLFFKELGVQLVKTATFNYILHDPQRTYSETGVHSTPSSVSPHAVIYKILSNESNDAVNDDEPALAAVAIDAASVASALRKGGIDMDNRLMDLDVKEDQVNRIVFDDQAMLAMPIDGVVPQVFAVVPVTPLMLKSMLGEPHLN
ncbi:MAG: hypothetical protein HY591_06750 [Candidatus Omnitrophica bacterium]|nr:hypothetical protein [Candidatus Omnitrophota bacterium]